MARYWRIAAIQTASGALALSALALSDGSTDYPSAVLDATLTPSFQIAWDCGADITVTQIKLTATTQAHWPHSLLLEGSADATVWQPIALLATITYPGDGQPHTVSLGDPFYASVALLLRADGADASTTFTDSSPSPKTVTAQGNAQISTAQSKFGGASMLFDGSGDYLSTPNSADFAFGTGDLAIEFWAMLLSLRADGIIFATSNDASGNNGMWVDFSGANLSVIGPDSTTLVAAPGVVSVDNLWHHWAITRSGGVFRVFKDGLLLASNTASVALVSTNPCIGGTSTFGGYNSWFHGYIDDLRITKGHARYSANFTPPNATLGTVGSGLTPPVVTAIAQPGGITHMADQAMPAPGLTLTSGAITALDMIDGGTHQVTGTVAEKALLANTPLARRVMLIDEQSHRVVRETWSDAAGNYTFASVRSGTTYTVLAYDHTTLYRAVIADRVTPELAP